MFDFHNNIPNIALQLFVENGKFVDDFLLINRMASQLYAIELWRHRPGTLGT